MNDLEMYREQLAMCDDKLIDALVERNGIIEKIMSYKETYVPNCFEHTRCMCNRTGGAS